jgi:hypothetical protein
MGVKLGKWVRGKTTAADVLGGLLKYYCREVNEGFDRERGSVEYDLEL